MKLQNLAAIILAMGASTCAASAPPDGPEPSTFEDRAEQATRLLQQRLQAELSRAMKAGGPPEAIGVCRERASAIAAELSRGDLTIRRVGTRVRNGQTNAPTAGEIEVLRQLTKEQPKHVGAVDGRQTYMKGIFIPGEVCLKCHGDAAQIAPATAQKIHELYPDDRAVDYKVGDLRGAFVVQQVP